MRGGQPRNADGRRARQYRQDGPCGRGEDIALAMALIMAAGVYGVISYTTSRRTQEIGIRMAVGATPGNVLSLIFRQGFLTVAVGLAVGLGAALGCLQFLRSILPWFDSDHTAYIWPAASLVLAAAGIACWIPAWRVTRIDPMSALRHESRLRAIIANRCTIYKLFAPIWTRPPNGCPRAGSNSMF
jgi:predicted lysophospholipase L1 biosynthesis ABC-type transport system permease subunit